MRDQLRQMAERALRDADGNKDEAARLLRKRIRESEIAEIVLTDLLEDEVWRLISRALTRMRRQHPVATAVAPDATETPETETGETAEEANLTVLGLKLKGERVYLDMLLSSGVTLGRAKRKDLEREIAEIEHAVAWNQTRAAWLRSIAERVTDGNRVQDVLSEDELRALKDAVR